MDNVRSTWTETADKLGGLGLKLKLHYEQQQAAEREAAQADAQNAMQRLSEAVQTAFEALGAAAKDTAVKEDVKQVGQSLAEALRATFTEVSGEVRDAMKRRSDSGAATEPPAGVPEPPAGETGQPSAGSESAPPSLSKDDQA